MVPISGCRSCASPRLTEVLDLGCLPLANALLHEADLEREEQTFPLTLMFCERCALAQIRETVSPELLFRDYVYLSSFSETALQHARQASATFTERFGLGPGSLVVEVASNDGYLLKNFVERGVPVLGIDPARNIATVAEGQGVPTLCAFFGLQVAQELAAEGRHADLIIANNVLAHVADLNGVAAGMSALLKPTGVVALEFPYVGEMIENVEFDTIYHEHLCYFSLHAMRQLFARHGLCVIDVERLAIHGGSLRVYLQPRAAAAAPSAAVSRLDAEEAEKGMNDVAFHFGFAARVDALRERLVAELERRQQAGQRLAAYGASAKGSTLMNSCGLGRQMLDFVVDRSTVKQGLYTPGNHLPILPPEALLERRPGAVLLLTWNFAEEIVRQQADYLRAGGEFIIPVPEVAVAGLEALG